MRNLLASGQQAALNNPEALIDSDDSYDGRPVEVKPCYVPPEEYRRSKELAQLERAPSRVAPERHSRKCSVCNHPEREAIEEDFIHWHSPINIARDFNTADHSFHRSPRARPWALHAAQTKSALRAGKPDGSHGSRFDHGRLDYPSRPRLCAYQ